MSFSRFFYLTNLPSENLHDDIGRFLETKDKANLAITSKSNNKLFQSDVRSERALALLEPVIKGNLDQVNSLLAQDPNGITLISLPLSPVENYSGQRIQQSPYQAALCAGDTEMVKLMQAHLLKRPDGEAILAAQHESLFSVEEAKEWELRKQEDSHALHVIIDAIEQADEQHLDELEPHLQRFRDYYHHRHTSEVIKTQRHTNLDLLLEAFSLYNEKYDAFQNDDDYPHNSPKNRLVLCKVIGFIQRYLPACDAQAFAQGIHYIVKLNDKLKRSFEFCEMPQHVFYPLDRHESFHLGYVFAASILVGSPEIDLTNSPSLTEFLEPYVRQKQQHWESFAAMPIHSESASMILK